ncbi:keratin-associated protein 27-1 [Rattus norvegicus]|uniref:Keratin-associated protein n=1 Tax=Rattus norvegicus TaxID=10116 RepID=A0ABK0LEG2_RAT|nr:keratin-associated protein 27-1 [Rattus norvegicus]|eukprot:XP_003751061.1 PREDICTED: keratin-associated protein 27-1 [Rattus norvegicus]
MLHSYCHSSGSLGKAPSLSSITHNSNPKSFEDGIFLPSSCHSRTWLLDNFQETHSETSPCQLTNRGQLQCKVDPSVKSPGNSRADQIIRSKSKASERTKEISPSVPEHASQTCQSRTCKPMGFVAQSYRPASYMTKCCLLRSTVFESSQTLEFESSPCCSQVPESSSCNSSNNTVSGPHLVESSSTYEPTCCVTGGSQLPSK